MSREISPTDFVDARPLDKAGRKLLEAADAIRQRGWCQGHAHDEQGRSCIIGVVHDLDAEIRLGDYLHKHGGPVFGNDALVYIARWNDMPGRTKEQVISALEQAAFSS